MARRLIGVVALLLVLSGCGGDPKADPSPAPSPSASPVSTTPSPSAPVMPAAASENTKAGAIAFVRYYIELINHAQATGDVDRLSAVESSGCVSCNKVRDAVKEIYGSGGHIQGGDWAITISSAARRPDLRAWSVFADVRYGPQVVTRSGNQTSLKGGASPMTFVVKNSSNGWTLLSWSRGS